jgi:hypothetical protein
LNYLYLNAPICPGYTAVLASVRVFTAGSIVARPIEANQMTTCIQLKAKTSGD